MKKIIALLLLFIAFAVGANVKPFVFTQIDTSHETQQAEWDYLLKYKVFGAEGIEFNNQLIRLPDKSGWFGTSHGDFIVEQNGQDTVGGKIIIGGKIFIKQGPLVLTTGPVRADSIVIDQKDNFRGKENFFGGPQCIGGTILDVYAGFIPDSNRFFNTACPDSVPTVKTNLFIPELSTKDTTYQPAIHIDQDHYDTIVVPADTGIYDVYIEGIYATNTGKLFIQMPPDSGRLTRVFLRDGIYLGSAHPRIQILYGDSLINNKDYAGNLLFYTDNDISFESFHNTDTIQGTFISTGTIKIAHHLTLAGQLLANKIIIDTDLDGSGFIFKPFDPPVLDFPKLNKDGGLVENDSTIALPIALDTAAIVDVYFNYCFVLSSTVDSSDFNIEGLDFPVCGISTPKTVKIPEGSTEPSSLIYINVKIDTLVELFDTLVVHIDSISGAVLPGNKTSGDLKIKITDAPIKNNTSIILDKADTINDYPEELLIPPGSGIVGNIKYTDDGLAPLVWTYVDPSGLFTIENDTIKTNHVFDYETEDTVYVIKVKVKDGDFTDSANYTIKITNINEPITATAKIDSVAENKPIGIYVGEVTGYDADSVDVKYYIDDTTNFKIDSITGEITTNKVFDYETKDKYTVKVTVMSDSSKKDLSIIVNIKDVDEPVHAYDDTLTVKEGVAGIIIGTVKGEDEDGDSIKFYCDACVHYDVNPNTGDIRLVDPFDYETTKSDTLKVVVTDVNGNTDTATVIINVENVNEPPVLQPNDSLKVPANCDTCFVGIIVAVDPDTDKVFYDVKEPGFKIDSNGVLAVTKPIDYDKTPEIKITVTARDSSGASDTKIYTIKITPETVKITEWDKNPPPDTVKTNDPDHEFKWEVCENDSCTTYYDNLQIHKDTIIKVCNEKKTVCDSIVVIFNDAPPVVTLTNAKSTDALIDYITIEEEKDDKIYVNKKENQIMVTVKDTVHKTEKHFDITVKLDTIPTKDIKVKEYNYLIDESLATFTTIGKGVIEMKEVIEVDGTKITLTQLVDKNGNRLDTVQTITYTKKVNGKDVTVSYKVDNLTGQRITDYSVSYSIDSCTAVSYNLDDKKKIVKNKEGNIAYTISYDYTDEFGNKAFASVEIIFDDIPPKLEILDPVHGQVYNTNAIPVKWTVNGETQDTLNLQRLEKGVNNIIRRYVDKAGNVAADTVMVIMKEAKDIDIELVHPVTMVDQDKVDEYYSDGHKYNDKKPYDVKFVDPKNDTIPDVIGVGFKVDIVLPSVSPTGSLATLDDIVKNGQIPVDDKGNIVGASTKGISVDQYVEEHCTEEFQKEYKKHGLNIPLYDVTYNLHLWVYTNNANYVNDFNIEFTLNDEAKTTSAGTVQMVIDWLSDRDGNVKAKNHHSLGTGAYLVRLYSTSIAKHRCDYKEQRKGDKTVKKAHDLKNFGYKRPVK